jgi:hypothetical protein
MLDNEEKWELLRDVAEHNAAFTNPEGVSKAREARKNSYSMNDEDFNELLDNTFGKRLDEFEMEELNNEDDRETNVLKLIENIKKHDASKYKEYIDMDLDEIKFIPMK